MTNTEKKLGEIQSVDTGTVVIKIEKEETLNNLQVNQLLQIRSTNTGESIIALISKIMRKAMGSEPLDDDDNEGVIVENLIKADLVGTWYEAQGDEKDIFKRSLEVVPSIGSDSFVLEEEDLTQLMGAVSSKSENKLDFGKYTIAKDTSAYLDGNKFFQRHAVIVGGTGSGKSWTVANILEKASELSSVNNIVFDLHGEYQPLKDLSNTTSLKIAGPSDIAADNTDTIFLPYWLLSYEEMEAMLLDRSDSNAPNQARALFDIIIEEKRNKLDESNTEQKAILDNFTIDSPISYDLNQVLEELNKYDKEMVTGTNKKEKQGPLHGKLIRFIQRLNSKQSDKRLNFIFNQEKQLQEYNWFENLVTQLMAFEGGKSGSKIIDFSEVPSDILPLITGLVARLIFSIQQWTDQEKRHPIALFCDEAHLYIPQNAKDSLDLKGLHNFERIAKEGRKYGVSLVVISQRPADVSKTILSQCGNFVAMRLTNPDDQNVIKRLFPDSLGGFADLLPMLDIGECLVVGDACLLPSRIKVKEPKIKPQSATIDIWTEWGREKKENSISQAVQALRQQSKITNSLSEDSKTQKI